MGLREVLDIDINGKNVLIIGCPASGKTWLSNKMAKPTHTIIHTDNYKKEGYEMGMYAAMWAATNSEKPTIVEGVYGYRMLRKGAELWNYMPNIVIEIKIPVQRMYLTYRLHRQDKDVEQLEKMVKGNEKVLNEYFKMQNKDNKPMWVEFNNNY